MGVCRGQTCADFANALLGKVNNAEMYIACCLAGLRLIQVPAFDLRDLEWAGALVDVLPDQPSSPMRVAVVLTNRPSLVATAKAYADWAERMITQSLDGTGTGEG